MHTGYELVRSRGYCRPALPKGRKHLMVETQTRQFDRCYKLICNHLTRKNAILQLVMEVILTFLLNHNLRELFIHLVTRLLYNDCYCSTLFHSNIITQRVKMSYKNIENHKTMAMEHESKKENHPLKEKKMILKAVGRSKNPKEPVLMWGHSGGRKYQEVCKPDLSPLGDIGLNDQPKAGGAMAPKAPTNLVNESKVNEDVKKVETKMSVKEMEQFERTVKMEWIDSWHPKITKKQIIANIHNRIR